MDTPTPPAERSATVRLREILLLGLLTLTPIVVTLWILAWVISTLDSLMLWVFPNRLSPTALFGYDIPGLGIIFTFLLIFLTGLFAKTYMGGVINKLGDSLISRLPVLGSLYGTTKQISKAVFSRDSNQSFKKVVLVPFPSSGCLSLGFFASKYDETQSIVFIPTAPNPTSGYTVIYKNSDLQESDLSIDEALKVILSCGSLGMHHVPRKA